jgi:hypothetical protein
MQRYKCEPVYTDSVQSKKKNRKHVIEDIMLKNRTKYVYLIERIHGGKKFESTNSLLSNTSTTYH